MQQRWLKSTVEEFFSSVNWDDRPIEVVTPKTLFDGDSTPDSAEPSGSPAHVSLSLTMSVSEFFDAFPWDGQPIIAAPIPVQETSPDDPPEDVNDVTLEDFSDLF
jgi:hypothetical protein